MPIYMEIEGITGGVLTAGFEGAINLDSFQWGVGRSVTGFSGTSRETSSPSLSEAVVTKIADSSSMPLLRNATFGEAFPEVVISFTRDKGKGEQEAYLVITLTDVLVSGHSFSSGGDVPSESLSLNFLQIWMNQEWRATDYAEGGSDEFKFNLRTMMPE